MDSEPVDLDTPTLKGNYYTTGRGGSGNMAKNTDPEEARRSQDVVAYVHLLNCVQPVEKAPHVAKFMSPIHQERR